MTPSDELAAAIQVALSGTPFELTRTAEGFDVALALADATWWMPLSRSGLKETYVYHFRCDDDARRLSVTDTHATIQWRAGVRPDALPEPYFHFAAAAQSGRVMISRRSIVWGVNDGGQVGRVVDVDFRSEPRRQAMRAIATDLGWTEGMGARQKVGLWVAIGSGVLALVVLVVLVIVVFAVT